MNQETTISTTEVSFKDFLFKNKRNRTILWLVSGVIIIQFAIFKYYYPYANFIHADSFVYIEGAYWNYDINNYMIGYSKFLRFFSVFTKSDIVLVGFQYISLQVSFLFLLFTLFYYFIQNKVTQIILLCSVILNPLCLYMANYISSDCMFLALSLIWFTLLFKILIHPTKHLIISQALFLFLLFTLRLNALIYPFISIIIIIASPQKIKFKLASILISLTLVITFIINTGYKYKQLTGIWQYTPFSGWQLANNAMYAYRYVKNTDRKPVPLKFKELDNMIRNYFDSTRDINKYPYEALEASTVYMWSKSLPLHKYMNRLYTGSNKKHSERWATMGPFYQEYGIWLITHYPTYYAKHFLWPNANKYFAPPVEFLGYYNAGKNKIDPIAQIWFEYNNPTVKTRFKNSIVNVLNFYPYISGIMNMVFLTCLVCFYSLKESRSKNNFNKALLVSFIVWLSNTSFTIFSSSVALRFQAFPIIINTTFGILLIDRLIQIMIQRENQPKIFDAVKNTADGLTIG